MRSAILTAAATAGVARAASLASVCTTSYVTSSLPTDLFGMTIDSSSVTAAAVYNASASGSVMFPDATFDFCNVTMAYSHNGRSDQVLLNFWLPSPDKFQNRWLSTGGGGLAINSGVTTSGSLPGGVQYGAVSGLTDGGFGGFTTQWDAVALLANGTINNEALYMFGYQAHHEMSTIGKAFTKNFFSMNSTKLYAYYQACSEGGREGWSQVQRFGDEWDGAIIGAPAFRYGQQQVNHLVQNVVEQTMGYFPPPCELAKIVNATIAACDPMDGLTDGVVSRTDLCKLNFNLNSTIGLPYSCAATTASGVGGFAGLAKRQFGGTAAAPAQNGTVSAQAVAVAAKILDGLTTLDGKRAYLPYQPAADFDDGATAYDSTTGTWGLSVSSLGAEWVVRYLELLDASSFETGQFDNVTYDTLRDWMVEGWQRYEDVLQTTWPDLTPFQEAGGKVIHYHGESDNSIPTASSVRYFESVREIMFPTLSYNDSVAELNKFYRLYLIPGAAHCNTNSLEANGPFPTTNLAVMIDWVENGVEPVTLNATHTTGDFEGQSAQICSWPLRPMWINNGTTMECQYDQASINSWLYDMDAYSMPLY